MVGSAAVSGRVYNRANIPCFVRGHNHFLLFVEVHHQEGTGQEAWTLECPTGMYRYLHIVGYHGVDCPLSGMPRTKRPRWGWSDKPPRKAERTRFKGTTTEVMGY
jgi:hypothetical protein